MISSVVISMHSRRQTIAGSAPSRDGLRNNSQPDTSPLLEARGLTKHFRVGGLFSRRMLHAVDDVSLTVHPRQIVAIAGESGSGKSTVARLLAGIYRPTSGDVLYRGQSILGMRS